MGQSTKIQWCHHTWNPWRGCAIKSEGCKFCYAEAGSHRNPAVLGVWGPQGRRPIAAEAYWRLPFRWNQEAAQAGERRRVFSLSLGDWLERRRDLNVARGRLLATIGLTPNLDWLLLTKRPESFRDCLLDAMPMGNGNAVYDASLHRVRDRWLDRIPPANVWVGASAENRERALERIPLLRGVPAAVRFLSCEPLLGDLGVLDLAGIHWMILGGESGPHARRCHVRWITDQIAQCRRQAVAPYVKQLGACVMDMCHESYHPLDVFPDSTVISEGKLGGALAVAQIHLKDPKGGDPDEWPDDLRIREVPIWSACAARAAP